MSFAGAVLTGGMSTRMGADKALLLLAGRPMVTYARDALQAAGAAEVLAVGGDGGRLGLLGLRAVPDPLAGKGPLAGIVAALREASHEVVVVLACDTPLVSERVILALLDALAHPGADPDSPSAPIAAGAIAVAGGRRQPLIAVYTRPLLDPFAAALAAGGSVQRAIASLRPEEPGSVAAPGSGAGPASPSPAPATPPAPDARRPAPAPAPDARRPAPDARRPAPAPAPAPATAFIVVEVPLLGEDEDAVLNVNSPADVALAEQWLAERRSR